MKRLWRRILRNAIGVLCLVLGVIGGVLPIMPGFVFFLAGLLLIDWPGRRWLLARMRSTKLFQNAEDRLHRRFGFRFDDDDHTQTPPSAHPPA